MSAVEPAARPAAPAPDLDSDPTDEGRTPAGELWGPDLVRQYRKQWRDLQLRFVDEPPAATRAAAQLVTNAVRAHAQSIADRKQALDGWQSSMADDTESLRLVMQRYREFLDHLLLE